MRRRYWKALSFPLFLLLGAVFVQAQRGGRSELPFSFRTIRGQVISAETNRPLNGAFVMLRGPGGGVFREMRVGANGRFEFDRLPSQVFFVVAEMGGYHSGSQRVDMGRQVRAYIPLILVAKKDRHAPSLPPGGEQSIAAESLAVPAEAREAFKKGRDALLNEKDMEKGQEYMREAIDLYPEFLQAYLLLGTSHIDQKEWEKAESVLGKALEINAHFADAHFALASLHKQQGDMEKAEANLERGLKIEANSPWAHKELAQILLHRSDLEGARKHAERAHNLDPDDPVVHVVLGNIYLRERTLEMAVGEYRHYLEREPEGPLAAQIEGKIEEIEAERHRSAVDDRPEKEEIWREYQKGLKLLKQDKREEALEQFRKVTEVAPEFAAAQHMYGVLLLDQGEVEQAQAVFTKCIDMDPNFAPSHLALGRLYNLERKPGKAVPRLERALALEPDMWKAHFELAVAFLAQKKVSAAEEHARQAHEGDGYALPEVHLILGNVGLVKHDLQLAREEFLHYLDLNPNGPVAGQLQRKVEQINLVLKQRQSENP